MRRSLIARRELVDSFKPDLAVATARRESIVAGNPRQSRKNTRRASSSAGDRADSVATWVGRQKGLVDWVKPDGGALCCLRSSPKAFDGAGVDRFRAALPKAELQIGDGAWFGESSSVLRLGFGYLPIEILPAALGALSRAVEAAARP